MLHFLMGRKEVNKVIKIPRRAMMKWVKKTLIIINWLMRIQLYMKVEELVDLEATEVMLDHKKYWELIILTIVIEPLQ